MDDDQEETVLERTEKRRGLPRSVRRALLSALVLLVLIVGGGVAYIWYTGSKPVVPVKTVMPVADTDPVIKPTTPGPNVPESAAIETLTSPINPGANVSINIKTLPKSQCTIMVMYGSVMSKDSGLVPKQADIYGTVNWTWTVESSVPAGSYPVHVSCTLNNKNAVVDGTLVVTTAPTDTANEAN